MNPELLAKYEPVIGLEVHAQMLTKSKAFCSCSTEFGAPPNSRTCPICLAHPGTLPMLNENLVRYIVRMGLATNCSIRERSIFARKNYFYPDLPKGYQISQYETPICHDGWIEAELSGGSMKRIGITRIHMEEDSGKSIHDFGLDTLVDLNRAGVPLIEIVSEPDMRSSEEGYAYLTAIKSIVTYLGICDGNMEEGSLRCDANVSVRVKGVEKFGQKTEVKNLNSFRNVKLAIEAEIERQIGVIESGEKVLHQTMLFDANKGLTRPMRSKEEAHDYRYFPEPDLLPVSVTKEYQEEVKKEIPELRIEKRNRFIKDFKLSKEEADFITESKEKADYFEATSNISTIENEHVAEAMKAAKVASEHVAKVMEDTKAARELVAKVMEATKPERELVAKVMEATKPERELVAKVMEATKAISEHVAEVMEDTKAAREHLAREKEIALKHVADILKATTPISKSIADIIKSNPSLKDSWSKQIYFNAHFMKGELQRSIPDWALASLDFAPQFLASLSGMVTSGTISNTIAKEVFQDSINSKKPPEDIVEEKSLAQISDESLLREKVREILSSNPDNIAKYKSGKTNLFGFFVGQTMKAMGGKANPALLNEVVKEELEKA